MTDKHEGQSLNDGKEQDGSATGLAERRAQVARHLGELIFAVSRLERYRAMSVADVDALLVQPLMRRRIVFHRSSKEAAGPEGIAIWASVSDEVSARLGAAANSGTFPLPLQPEEWSSGDNVWLIDVIAPTKAFASATFRAFGVLMGERTFRIHPIILQNIDPASIERTQATPH